MPNIIQEHLKVIQHHLFHYIQIILEYDPTYYINDYIRTNYLQKALIKYIDFYKVLYFIFNEEKCNIKKK